MSEPKDGWRKDIGRCELSNDGRCLANIPKACICGELKRLARFNNEVREFNEWLAKGSEAKKS